MIIERALFREAAVNTFAIALILFIFMFFLGLTRLLGKITIGGHTSQVIIEIFSLKMIQSIDTMLPLALFLGVLLATGRWYRDNEMAVLAACGIGLIRLLRPLLVLAMIVAGIVSLASFWVSPWAALETERLQQSSTQTMAFSGIRSGVFSETWPDRRTYFVEHSDTDAQRLSNVFISSLSPVTAIGGRHVTVFASRGMHEVDDTTGQRYLILQNGYFYDGSPGQADYQIVSFDSYRVRISSGKLFNITGEVEYMNLAGLLRDGSPHAMSQIHWRLARPVAVLVLAVIALVLAHTDPRRGRFTNLFVAIFVFFLYSNLLGVAADMLDKGKTPMYLGLWWVHAQFVVVAAYLFWRRNNQLPLLPVWKISRK